MNYESSNITIKIKIMSEIFQADRTRASGEKKQTTLILVESIVSTKEDND
jgi:hypothetical protein